MECILIQQRIKAIDNALKSMEYTHINIPKSTYNDLKNAVGGNYYGEMDKLNLGGLLVEVESVWSDLETIYVHVCHHDFEGDIILFSLSTQEVIKVLEGVKKAIVKLNGITI